MSNEFFEEPVSPQVQELLNVFKNEMSSVSFPDVNLEILETLVQKVTTGAKELNNIMKQAEDIRKSLEESRNELTIKSLRGLAYAKVFAEGNSDLIEKLSNINFGKTSRNSRKSSVEKPDREEKDPAETTAETTKTDDRKHAKQAKKATEPEQPNG